ncbi:MAG: helical backbone metal receptor, partial [Pseudomonadota bacterium]|nr:helical backbone metal receptor [Pseudomonadota bacterium]
ACAVEGMPRETVLYLIWKKPWMTISTDTYIADALSAAHWTAVVPRNARCRYPHVAENDEAWRCADRILLSSEPYAFVRRDVEALTRLHGPRVHLIDGEMTSWYGPRAIRGMDYLAALRREITMG